MPTIPGVTGASKSGRKNPLLALIIGMLVLGLLVLLGSLWLTRHPKPTEAAHGEATPQIDVPSPPADPATLLAHATEAHPEIASLADLAKAWSSVDFFIRNNLTGENVPATIIRLPSGSPGAMTGYWAFSRVAPYGSCQLEYISDLAKLRKDYDYRKASHPLVGNPCSRTLYDPLKTANLPGNVWIRGGIVQGSDIRPPLGIEIKIQGQEILAIRSE